MATEENKGLHCKICNINFKTNEDFTEHEWSFLHHKKLDEHQKGVRHMCELCMATTVSLTNYREHVAGKKHKRAMAMWQADNNLQSENHFTEGRRSNQREFFSRENDNFGNHQGLLGPSPYQFYNWSLQNFTRPRRGKYSGLTSKRNPFHETFGYDDDGRVDCSYSYKPTKRHSEFRGDPFHQENNWSNGRGFGRGMAPPSLLSIEPGNWHPSTSSFMGPDTGDFTSQMDFSGNEIGGANAVTGPGDSKETGCLKIGSAQDANKVDIVDFRSSLAKKADLATPSSTDDVDAKTKSTLQFSAKASQIIDDVLMGRPPKPKITTKEDLELSKHSSLKVSKVSKNSKADKGAQLLERAKQICEQSRMKRQLANQARAMKDNLKRAEDMENLNKEIDRLTKKAMGNIRGCIDEKSESNIVTHQESHYGDSNSVHNTSQLSIGKSNSLDRAKVNNIPTVDSENRSKCLSVHIPNTDTQSDVSETNSHRVPLSQLLSPPVPRGRKKIGKDDLKKLVTAPRSRKDQMLVAEMMQTYSKAKPSSRPKLTTGSDSQSDLESPIHVEDLPDDVQMQIAQLLEEETEGDTVDREPGVMDITELDANKPCSVIESDDDDLEMVMILEDESHAGSRRSYDDSNYVEEVASNDHQCIKSSASNRDSHPSNRADDMASSSHTVSCTSPKRRRRRPETTSKEEPESPDTVQLERDSTSKRPRIDAKTGRDIVQNNQHSDEEKASSSQQQRCNGTVERLLSISLEEENIRNKLVQTDKEIQELQMLLMQTQQQLQSKIALREQLYTEEGKLRNKRMDILRGAVSESESLSSSQQSSFPPCTVQLRHIKPEPTSPGSKETQVVVREPDTTTAVGSSPDPSPGQIFSNYTEERCHKSKEETIQECESDVRQRPRCDRTVSQSSADQSGDGEYTAQYLGTLHVDTEENLLKQLAANLADLQQASYMFVNEGDIENSDDASKPSNVNDEKNSSYSEATSGEKNKVAIRGSGLSQSEKVSEEGNKSKKATKDSKSKKTSKGRKGKTRNSNESSSERLDIEESCKVKLEKLDSDTLKCIRNGSPIIVQEEEDNINTSAKMESVSSASSPATRKKRKTKKERDRSRGKVKTVVSLISSDGSATEDQPTNELTASANRAKRKSKKLADSPDCKILQEYLYAPSSSDVELESYTEVPSKSCKDVCAEDPDKLKIKPSQMTALRLSAQKTSFVRRQSIDELQKTVVGEQRTKTYEGHTGTVHCMQVYDGKLFTGSEDHTAMKFDIMTCECEAVYRGHSKGVQCLCVSKQPRSHPKLITGSFDATIIAYNIETDTKEGQLTVSSRVLCMCESHGKLYVGLADGTISVVNHTTMKEVDILQGSDQSVRCIKTGKEGTRDLLLTASVDGTISIRDIRSGLFFRSIMGHTKTPFDMQVVNNLLYSAGADKTVQIHDINTGDFVESLGHRGVVTSVWVQDDHFYTAGYESVVRCYNNQTYEKEKMYYGAGKGVITSMLVHDNKLFTGAKEGMVESICLPEEDVNWTCKFGRCAKVFGLKEHLEHHVVRDHIISSQPVLKCLWTDCDSYLHVQDKKQETIQHILHHLDVQSSN